MTALDAKYAKNRLLAKNKQMGINIPYVIF
jgi:hypothetical protein